MSVNCLSWSFKLPLHGLALKGTLNALADHADPQGRCWPSIDRLALYAGCDRKTVRKALKDLEGKGVIRRQPRRGKSDIFELVFTWSPACGSAAAPLPELVGVPKVVPVPELGGPPLPELVGDPSQSWYPNRQEPSVEPSKVAVSAKAASTAVLVDEPCNPDQAFSLYLEAAKRLGWAQPRKLDADRRKALVAILKEWDGLDGWRDALGRAEASDFIMGRAGRSPPHDTWRCSLDFLLMPKKFRRLMEGGYGGGKPAAARGASAWAGMP